MYSRHYFTPSANQPPRCRLGHTGNSLNGLCRSNLFLIAWRVSDRQLTLPDMTETEAEAERGGYSSITVYRVPCAGHVTFDVLPVRPADATL